MELLKIYARGLALLGPEKWRAWALAGASIALAIVQLAEPILFGRVVDALSSKKSAASIIAMWAAIGLFGILAGVIVAVHADRMAHRRRLAIMSQAFEHAIILPLGYHAEQRLERRRARHPRRHRRAVLELALVPARAVRRLCRHRSSWCRPPSTWTAAWR